MSYSPLAIKRHQVLGDIYNRCEKIESLPVYMNDPSGELLGHVDESLGQYADAFVFHLSEDICKKLSSGHYSYGFDYEVLENEAGKNGHIRLNYILLVGKRVISKKA
jgi:hypothetical protein